MLYLARLADRILGLLRAVAVALVCLAGTWVFLEVIDERFPIAGWLSGLLLPIWAYTLLFNAACVAGGAAVLRALFGSRRLPALEWLVLSMAVGLVVFVLGMYVAGAFCQFSTTTACALPVVMLALGIPGTRRLVEQLSREALPRSSLPARAAAFLAAGFGATCLAFMYLEALDVSSINFDASWYHYPIAQDYARTGCLIPFPGDTHRAYPHLTSIVHTWALLVPGLKPLPAHWMLSLHLEYSIVVWRIVSVAAAVQWLLYGKRIPGLWAVFFLFPSIFVYDQNIGGSADHFLGFFAIPIALATARTLRRFEWRWAIVLGAVMGGHLLTKYQALFMLVSVTLAFVLRWAYVLALHWLRRRRSPAAQRRLRWRRLLLGPGVAMGVAIAVSAPHFVKNAVFYHNPLYPYARSVFKASWPNLEANAKAAVDDEDEGDDEAPAEPPARKKSPAPSNARRATFAPKGHGIEHQVWGLRQVYEYSFTSKNRGLTERRPYMGALFSLLLPCLLFARGTKRIWFVAGLGIMAFMVWVNAVQNDRYLLSFYDLFIAAAGALMVRVWQLGWIARAGLVPLVAAQLFWGGDAMLFYGAKRLKAALALVSNGYSGKTIESRIAGQPSQQKITAATPVDAVILSRSYKGLLGLDRLVLHDFRGGQYYISYTGVRNSNELWKLLRDRGITHLLYPDGQRPPHRLNNTVLFADLFHVALNVQKIGGLRLGTLPPQPPPAGQLLVLVHKMRGYRDGVYRVEHLDVDDYRAAPQTAHKPVRRSSDQDDRTLLDGVKAVVLGSGARLSSEAQAELDRSFEQVERFKQFSVYLRRRE